MRIRLIPIYAYVARFTYEVRSSKLKIVYVRIIIEMYNKNNNIREKTLYIYGRHLHFIIEILFERYLTLC